MATHEDPAPDFDLPMDASYIEKRMDFILQHQYVVHDEMDAVGMAIIELECELYARMDENATQGCINAIAEKIVILENEREQMAEYSKKLKKEFLILDEMLETLSIEEDTLSASGSEIDEAMDESRDLSSD
ncbi:hypothetical protein CAPTEDRAFT_210450 [Capitella teleta]|uniref:Uncharacterized protein n=1 Tax=Capitella teleta TaxID=283909 RepID=R7U421_CAPTE|nr:hypothetical protein CAPTEDRAFT_210450 [Capitella teleta]|eukprot:ELU00866.1 hypothetical protein CAPTEDRAFT_210450 [Capitella teleta]